MQEGIKNSSVSEACRRFGIAPNLFYRGEPNRERRHRLWGSAAAAETEKDRRVGQLKRRLSRKQKETEILKKVGDGVSCDEDHSQGRDLMVQGK